jgi:polygalacturonase
MESCGGGWFIEIRSSNVDLDLLGHTLTGSGRNLTIWAKGSNIVIRNGVIKNGSIHIQSPDAPTDVINGNSPWVEPDFREDNFARIEKIRIEEGGISIAGANAVVRNNDVTLGAGFLAPVTIYGPHPIVENNRLIRDTEPSKLPSYGIYLRKGDDAVVRNNTILNNGTRENTAAIGLRNSVNAHIENNRIDNFEQPIDRIGKSGE